jgi:hypothetical protein
MSRFKSLLLCAGVLGGLLSFAHGAAFAQTANAEAGTSSGLRAPGQRIALVIGNSNTAMHRSSLIPTMMRNRWRSF